jgi:hypothetical protein
MSMKERNRQTFLERVEREREAARPQPRKRARSRVASREEQQARYLECGPLAWDDRGLSPDY